MVTQNPLTPSEPQQEQCELIHWQEGVAQLRQDTLPVEAPLEIRLAGRALTVTMRTPGHDEELAIGLLYNQGMLRDPADLGEVIVLSDDSAVDLHLSGQLDSGERWRRYSVATSSCGLCGVESLDALSLELPHLCTNVHISIETLYGLDSQLRTTQDSFGRTGGTHAAALFSLEGELIVAREDVGRHNAVDKVVGYAFRTGLLPLDATILMVSGRISYEIVQKTLQASIPLLAAISAPTDLAVRMARDHGLTLIGFLRQRRMNVYSHAERIQP